MTTRKWASVQLSCFPLYGGVVVAYVCDDIIRLQAEKLFKDVGILEHIKLQTQGPETCTAGLFTHQACRAVSGT